MAANRETKLPVSKNVAGTCAPCSVARIEVIASSLAPASSVSATTLRVVGMYVQSVPASRAGMEAYPVASNASWAEPGEWLLARVPVWTR